MHQNPRDPSIIYAIETSRQAAWYAEYLGKRSKKNFNSFTEQIVLEDDNWYQGIKIDDSDIIINEYEKTKAKSHRIKLEHKKMIIKELNENYKLLQKCK